MSGWFRISRPLCPTNSILQTSCAIKNIATSHSPFWPTPISKVDLKITLCPMQERSSSKNKIAYNNKNEGSTSKLPNHYKRISTQDTPPVPKYKYHEQWGQQQPTTKKNTKNKTPRSYRLVYISHWSVVCSQIAWFRYIHRPSGFWAKVVYSLPKPSD